MVHQTAGALRDRVKEVAASISWHLFAAKLIERFVYSDNRFNFVKRWWTIRHVTNALRKWRYELIRRVEFLVTHYGPDEEVGEATRELILLPEYDWFALWPSDRPRWDDLWPRDDLLHGLHGLPDGLPLLPELPRQPGVEDVD